MLSDEWLQRYRLLENFTAKWNGNGNGNAYDRGDYNSYFALHAVELKMHTPENPSFTIQDRGERGYKSHGCVFLMEDTDNCKV